MKRRIRLIKKDHSLFTERDQKELRAPGPKQFGANLKQRFIVERVWFRLVPGMLGRRKRFAAIRFHGGDSSPDQLIVRIRIGGHKLPGAFSQSGYTIHKGLLQESLSVVLEYDGIKMREKSLNPFDAVRLPLC
jgi:hypothetical protein